MRNGLAIAGMAGGIFFLGQAAASADTDANASGDINSSTQGEGGGSADSTNYQDVEASNDVENDASTGDIDASGGVSYVTVVAGNGNTVKAGSNEGDVDASQNVATTVNVASEANGGSVSGSNNANAGNGGSYHADANGTINSDTTGGSGHHGGDATSYNDQDVDASNDVDNDADSGDIDVSGGLSAVDVVAGNGNTVKAGSDEGDVDASQNVHTTVDVSSEANGGSVHGSNNANAGNGGSYHADANGTINSDTTGGSGNGRNHHGGDAYSDNEQDVDGRNDVENDADTGDIDAGGGKSIVEVIAGNGNKMYCWSNEGDVTCTQNVTTIINIISMANGGNVTCSNNAAAGQADNWVCTVHEADKPAAQPAPAPVAAPVVHQKTAAPVQHRAAPVNTYAQPKGELAYTGAETTAPLALGLIALGAGGALTLAGRRRTASAAV